MANPISNIPILLFPLKLETRFVNDELWIRAFPDEAFLQSHDPNLTEEEKLDAKAFKKQTPGDDQRKNWEELVAKHGVYRSSWLVQISEAELTLQQANNKKEEEPSFYFKWLPDRLVFYLYKAGDKLPSYQADGSVINREGLTVLGKGDEWMQDFDKAQQAGMGIKIKLNPADTKFERVIVSGFRYDSDPLLPAKGLADLFNNHQYTEGFSFLKYGTPTNNTDKAISDYSAKDEFEVVKSYKYAVEGLNLESGASDNIVPDIHTMSGGKYLSAGLGFNADQLKHVQHADQTPTLLNELYQKATWFGLGAQPLFMLFGNQISSEFHEAIWKHYSKYVKGRGLYPALKIGNQPYGILSVMNISNVFLPENKDIRDSEKLFDKMTVIFARLMKQWLLMTKGDQSQVPRLHGNDSYEDILKILSMQEASGSYQIRAMEYNFSKSKLYESFDKRPTNLPVTDFIKTLGAAQENLLDNTVSLSGLLEINNRELSPQFDQLLRAQVLSLAEGDANLIGFEDDKSILTDQEGSPLSANISADNSFSFTQADLGNFQDFINAISQQKENELIQYMGDLSVFTDLFVRSYINACQLYDREIVFDPEMSQSIQATRISNGATILKAAGTDVKKGEPVISLKDPASGTINVVAPFDGKIKAILVDANSAIAIGTPLFTLINEEKNKEIKQAFISLGQQIIAACNSIKDDEDRKEAQRKAMAEAIDLNSYRLDAWITSLAASRIQEMRAKTNYQKGIYFGAYGWIEDLEKDATPVDATTLSDIYREKGGIIHTPGAAQTVATTVFKNSFLAHQQEEQSNPFTINLSSDRLQKSKFLLEGIRQGQQLEALLGYQLERYLHEDDLHNEIYQLRESFPLYENTTADNKGFVHLSVIDGLKAINNKAGLTARVQKHVSKLEDTMDASLDTLFYEAGYQVTQSNLTQAAAAINATKGENDPPIIESLKTKIPGTGISHRLVMAFPGATAQFPIDNSRAFAEPNLEQWLAEKIGPMNGISCMVERYLVKDDSLIDSKLVTLAELSIGYLDFLYASDTAVSNGTSELELRIKTVAFGEAVEEGTGVSSETGTGVSSGAASETSSGLETRYVITNPQTAQGKSLSSALEVARHAKTLITKFRYLKSDDLTLEAEKIKYDHEALSAIKNNRLLPLIAQLKAIKKSDLVEKSTLKWLANLDFDSAKTAYLSNVSVDVDKLEQSIQGKLASAEAMIVKYNTQVPFYTAFGFLQQAAKMLFGETFVLLPPASASEQFIQTIKADKQQLLVGNAADEINGQSFGQERIKNWLQGIAQVQENAECFEDWLMVNQVWNQITGLPDDDQFQVVQGPTLLQYPWVALSKQEIDIVINKHHTSQPVYKDPRSGETYPFADGTYYPDNCESTVLYASQSISPEQTLFGFVIDEFSEHVPDKKLNTGLSFNYNIPNNEPPQAILLAIHPKSARDSEFFWSEADLRDILYDTMDLYKIRMVDIEAIQEYGYVLPMTYWFNLPGHK